MLPSIYQKISAAFRTNRRRKASRRVAPERLAIESLESRKLLTTATLTYGSISDGGFAAPAVAANAYQVLSAGAPAASSYSSPWTFAGAAA